MHVYRYHEAKGPGAGEAKHGSHIVSLHALKNIVSWWERDCGWGSWSHGGRSWSHAAHTLWTRELSTLAVDTASKTHPQRTSARPASCPRNSTISPNRATLWGTKYLNSWACWGHFTFKLGHYTFIENAINNGLHGPLRTYAW